MRAPRELRTKPESGCWSPARTRKSVLLPDPLGADEADAVALDDEAHLARLIARAVALATTGATRR
jgi:hypothetical protein